MKRLLRFLRFGWPDILTDSISREEYEKHLENERREKRYVRARLRALEVEYGIPPREERIDNTYDQLA